MKSSELAAACGVSQRQIYNLKTKFPKEVPASFEDVAGWRKVVEAHRVTVAAKRHAPRSNPDMQSDHARYVAARARRTESLAEGEAIRLAVIKRDVIPRGEVERFISRSGAVLTGRLMRMVNDCSTALLGLDSPQINACLLEKVRHALDAAQLEKEFRIMMNGGAN